jgi:hypothetical protein
VEAGRIFLVVLELEEQAAQVVVGMGAKMERHLQQEPQIPEVVAAVVDSYLTEIFKVPLNLVAPV